MLRRDCDIVISKAPPFRAELFTYEDRRVRPNPDPMGLFGAVSAAIGAGVVAGLVGGLVLGPIVGPLVTGTGLVATGLALGDRYPRFAAALAAVGVTKMAVGVVYGVVIQRYAEQIASREEWERLPGTGPATTRPV